MRMVNTLYNNCVSYLLVVAIVLRLEYNYVTVLGRGNFHHPKLDNFSDHSSQFAS